MVLAKMFNEHRYCRFAQRIQSWTHVCSWAELQTVCDAAVHRLAERGPHLIGQNGAFGVVERFKRWHPVG